MFTCVIIAAVGFTEEPGGHQQIAVAGKKVVGDEKSMIKCIF